MVREILEGLLRKRWKTSIFSITSICNCKCPMCNIPNLPNYSISLNDAFDVLHQCSKNNVLFLSITGGEPFMYPRLPDLARRAREMGFIIHVATNGTLPKRIQELMGLVDLIGFSVDSVVASEHDRNRGHKGAFEKCRRGIENCKKFGINATVNTPPNEYIIDEVEDYVKFMNNEWEVPVAFCYPETGNRDYFTIDENPVSILSREQIADFFRAVLKLKESGYEIFNTDVFLEESIRYARGKYDEVGRCKSGNAVYWIDWFGNVYPCFSKEVILNEKEDWETYDPEGCNDCFTQCFREPSSVTANLPFMIKELKVFRGLL